MSVRISFDADVLIYAASGHPLGQRVAALFTDPHDGIEKYGSTLLLPEVLTKPKKNNMVDESDSLWSLLGQIELWGCDEQIAQLAIHYGATYHLRVIDAVHFATAVAVGSNIFLTNNHRDYSKEIQEIHVMYPAELHV